MNSDWVTNFGNKPMNVEQNEIGSRSDIGDNFGNIRRLVSQAGKFKSCKVLIPK